MTGRPITDEDNADTRPVAVINQAFARKFFGQENPIGKHFGPVPQRNARMYEIVGVMPDIGYFWSNAGRPERAMYLLPEAQTTHFNEAATEAREVWSYLLCTTS